MNNRTKTFELLLCAMTPTCFSKRQMSQSVDYYTAPGSLTAHLLPAVGTVTVEARF